MSLAAGTRLGPYEVLGLIGAGGMGEVYEARDTRLDRTVAIKVLPDDLSADADRLRRFEREAHAVAALDHPNILAIHDVGSHEGTAYAVMERLEGETLRQHLARGALPLRKAIQQAIEIARGLGAAHDKGIVHRDLKPENVFVTTDGRVKILDFGLARQQTLVGSPPSEAATATRDTAPGVILGTVGYMSPEQVRGIEVDARSDVFAFGCVFFEMLTGRRAFERETATETMTAILREDPPDTTANGRALPLAVERTTRRCLEKNPAERFQSARDIAFALEAVAGDSPSSGASVVLPPRRTWRRLAPTALVAVAAIGGIGLSFLAGRRTAPEVPRLTYEKLTFRQGVTFSARFGPDGQTVFYGAAWEGHPFRIYQTRPEGGELQLPIENADLLSVSTDGQLAVLLLKRFGPNSWWKTGTLAVVPVLGGAPRELADDVRAADWAPDGKTMAVVREAAGMARLEFPLGRVIYERSNGYIFYPRVSPSGGRVAFFEGNVLAGFSISVVDGAGHKTVLSEGWTDAWDLSWSPDGREVWFAGTKSCAGEQTSIYAVDMQGRRRVLMDAPGAIDIHDVNRDGRALVAQVASRQSTRMWSRDNPTGRSLSWLEYSWPADLSPDGQVVLLNVLSRCTAGSQASYGSYLWSLDSAGPVRVADNLLDGRLSPDQRSLLFSEPRRIRVVPVGAGTPRTLDLGFTIRTALGAQGWLPGGERIVVAADEGAGSTTLRVLAERTGQQLSASAAFVPDAGALISNWLTPVSPDGRVVAVKAASGQVLVVPLDGSPPHPVPDSDVNELPVQWSDDSQSLFVFRPGEIPSRVFRLEVAGGRRTLWTEIRPPDPNATGIGGLYLTRDGRTGVYSYAHAQADLYVVNGLR